mgnify:CR=1 FL=1
MTPMLKPITMPTNADRGDESPVGRWRSVYRWWVLVLLLVVVPNASGQPTGEPLEPIRVDNPVTVIEEAAEALPGFEGGLSGTINVMILLTVLSLAPAIVILCTSFVRIVVVLALLRQAIGTQTLPPSQVLVGL